MPTVIDTLIIQLGLDPTKFTQGQRQAVGQLRQFHGQVNTQLNQTSRAFLSLLRPMTQVQQGQNATVNNARRLGLAVQAGAKQGQSGLLAMAAAGTAAFAAIKSVQGIYNQLTSTISATAGLGRLAQQAGVAAPWLSRLQNAAYTKTAADTGATGQSVFNLRQKIERLQAFGEFSEELEKLSVLGIDFNKGSPEEIIQRIFTTDLPKYLKSLSLPRALAFGSSVGLSRELTQFYHGYNPQEEMNKVGAVSATDAQIKSASELAEAIRRVETAWTGLVRALQTNNPWLTKITEQFADWLTSAQKSPEALDAIGAAATVLFGGTLVAIVTKFLAFVGASNAALVATPLGRAVAAAFAATSLLTSGGFSVLPHEKGPEDEALQNAPGPNKENKGMGFWQSWNPKNWAVFGGKLGEGAKQAEASRGAGGGAAGGGGMYTPGAGALSRAEIRAHAYAAGFRGRDLDIMTAIAMQESSGNPNAISKTGDYGLTQINAKAWGADVAQSTLGNPARAMQVAHDIYGKAGGSFRDWSSFNSGAYRQYLGDATAGGSPKFSSGNVDVSKVRPELVATAKAASAGLPEGYSIVATSGARTGGLSNSQHHGGGAMDVQIVGPDGKPIANRGSDTTGLYTRFAHSWYNAVARMHPELLGKAAWGGEFGTSPGSPDPDLMHIDFGGRRGHFKQAPWAYLDATKVANTGNLSPGGALGGDTHNYGDISIGSIPVNTQATDAKGIAYGIGGALKQNLLTSQANTGLS